MSALDQQLKDVLGQTLPEINALGTEAKTQLLKDLQAARLAHETHLSKAMDDALSHLPMLLRLPVRKLFGI